MELTVRSVNANDEERVLELLQKAALRLKYKGLSQWSYWLNPPAEKLGWVAAGVSNYEFYFIENQNSKVVGMFRLSTSDELYWGETNLEARYLHSLVVDPHFAGKGIGDWAINYVENRCMSEGINRLRLDCVASNSVLCSYYEAKGFIKVGSKQMPLSKNNLYEKWLEF